ncbi:MAG: bifunctional pyr operon transcriptional regulator/uracil phosphoribosyltransferase PyrR [Anaeroplasmataceae bacterium]
MKMKTIIDKDQFNRMLKRITHEIIEKNDNLKDIVLIGIKNKGVPIAKFLASTIKSLEDIDIEVLEVDTANFRDDKKKIIDSDYKFNHNVNEKVVILVDDVLYTGRSVRAAMDAVLENSRPSKIELAVLVDRGHRELPIRADFVGKNIPTSKSESVVVDFANLIVTLK